MSQLKLTVVLSLNHQYSENIFVYLSYRMS